MTWVNAHSGPAHEFGSAAQETALALTGSLSVMTRALLEMDTAACFRIDGDPSVAADAAASAFAQLPHRPGPVPRHRPPESTHRPTP
ncbi:hypothetical protein ACFCZT_16840 [Streptomyces sp. NPDC056230]|uniref:hypothetical protein n=1 Tax=Streptomyces sp. NPDC056230 TaxID=3345754 RepID=UPI0035E18B67